MCTVHIKIHFVLYRQHLNVQLQSLVNEGSVDKYGSECKNCNEFGNKMREQNTEFLVSGTLRNHWTLRVNTTQHHAESICLKKVEIQRYTHLELQGH